MELHASDTKSEKITTQISGEPHSLVANNLDRSTGASPRPTTDQSGDDDDETFYLQGARYWAVSVLTAIMLFLVQIETTIVTTSLVAISHSIGGFEISSWVISSYLLGYVGKCQRLFGEPFWRKTSDQGRRQPQLKSLNMIKEKSRSFYIYIFFFTNR